MTSYCPVCPPQILQHFENHGLLGKSHLLLAHDIVKDANQATYRSLFGYQQMSLVILDNSVVELGSAVDISMIKDASDIVRPTHIVLPDCYLDTDATIISCQNAIDLWDSKINYSGHSTRITPFMYLPQGKTWKDFARCAEALSEDPRITAWGIPRNIVGYLGSREKAVTLCHTLNPGRYIHLFGFSDDMVDDLYCSKLDHVSSIDSAVPIRCPTKFNVSWDAPSRGTWWDDTTPSDQQLQNLEIARSLFR